MLPDPVLCLVTDRRRVRPGRTLEEQVRRAIEGGVNLVQVREKDLATRDLAALAARLRDVTEGQALLVVNSDVGAAMAVDADGVHLPEGASPTAEVRRRLRPDALVGRSVHGVEAAVLAAAEGADYLVVGTMFATPSHPGKAPEGPGLLREIAGKVRTPLLGIGGIDAANAGDIIEAGARGVAVVSALLEAKAPEDEARRLRDVMLRVREAVSG